MSKSTRTPLHDLRDAVERVMQEGAATLQGTEAVPVDIYQTDTHIVFKANIIGVAPEEIDVSITANTLTIKGETTPDVADIPESTYIRRERRFGKFERTFHLAFDLAPEEAAASYKSGVLTISIPKLQQVQTKKIEIRSET